MTTEAATDARAGSAGDAADALAALGPVLIANRGEIAVRIARTVRALGLRSVAVFSDADATAPHVDACDVAVRIGPADATRSYLSVDALLDAARRSGARSVHPGYGFLSESAAFARAVADAGLTWIGPPADAIEVMGDKARAKVLAREAGVPVVPGIESDAGGDLDEDAIRAFADEHGLPVVVKALAGGGGKGMRVVREAGELGDALGAARREAKAAFGDDRVLVERYLERPRHIEVQVLADEHGNVVHLGERECSLQRRHQKVVEEAPSPIVGPTWRDAMGASASELVRACGYRGVGTVEFIVPGDEAQDTGDGRPFFFLETNTRLQVEHPVTEMVFGVDLVEQQLRVAAGEPLALAQEDLVPDGHAVEVRVYAEDPAAGFLPAVGTVRRWRPPSGPGIRVDAGLAEGGEVTTHYDPMVAKVVAHGPDRATALRRVDRALGDLELVGLSTNATFTRALLGLDAVRRGDLDTGLLERELDALVVDVDEDLLPAAALAAAGTATPEGPWRRRYEGADVRIADGRVTVTRPAAGEDDEPDVRAWAADVRPLADGAVRVELDGLSRRYAACHDGDDAWIVRDGQHLEARAARAGRSGAAALAGSLEAPMPGTVLAVHVADGDHVTEGQTLLVLESMKMELQVAAPTDGVVQGLELAVGDRVGPRQTLVAVVPEGDA